MIINTIGSHFIVASFFRLFRLFPVCSAANKPPDRLNISDNASLHVIYPSPVFFCAAFSAASCFLRSSFFLQGQNFRRSMLVDSGKRHWRPMAIAFGHQSILVPPSIQAPQRHFAFVCVHISGQLLD
ncbi:hypothetical protein CC86DRAFT_110334 [Ophiobolus disseminans]|uniref:Secreted protein n=1 Tax=Ophiobolus disseminans TaxID=1469910 RepID=A0A6A6ZLU0_9PLEO|nr:hypothetical protein CC86DRAFT_110334 [Ophiobolus disseminans]